MYNKNINKMTQEQLRMQMLAGIITEGQYKKMLNEERDYIVTDDTDSYGDPVKPYIETHLFLDYFYNLLSQAGYEIPEDVGDAISAEAYDGDLAYLDHNDPKSLNFFENFNLQDAIEVTNEILRALKNEGEWEYNSIEDFKVR